MLCSCKFDCWGCCNFNKYLLGVCVKNLVVGSGISGRAVKDYLVSKNIDSDIIENFDSVDIEFVENELTKYDQIIISPGVKLDKNIKLQIKKNKIALLSELEFGVGKLKNDIIAVTGTNGKTTTVSLIGYLLRNYFGGCVVAGNIGVPITSLINKLSGEEIVVLECSSFQLETIKNFSPHIAIILNISEDHLNRHGTMKEYIRCKFNITKRQNENDYLILNADDEYLVNNLPKTKAKIFYISTKRKVVGCYLKKNFACFFDGVKEEKLVSLSNIKLKGEHNLLNILAAVLSVYLQTNDKKFLADVSNFLAVEHRIEFVKNIRGVDFYNDSKATNIVSTIVACKSFRSGINLILGGSDKGYSFDELFKNLPKNVKNIAIFGETKNKIAFSASKFNCKNIYIFDSLKRCVLFLFEKSLPGEIVLLSPACASFDQFENFEHRGNVFKNIVDGLK